MDEPLRDIDKVINLVSIRKDSQVQLLLNKILQNEIRLIDDIKVEHIEEDTQVSEAIKKTIAEAGNLLKAGTKENHHVNSEKLQEYLIMMKLNSSPLYNLLEELTG